MAVTKENTYYLLGNIIPNATIYLKAKRSKETSKFRVTGLAEGNPPATDVLLSNTSNQTSKGKLEKYVARQTFTDMYFQIKDSWTC